RVRRHGAALRRGRHHQRDQGHDALTRRYSAGSLLLLVPSPSPLAAGAEDVPRSCTGRSWSSGPAELVRPTVGLALPPLTAQRRGTYGTADRSLGRGGIGVGPSARDSGSYERATHHSQLGSSAERAPEQRDRPPA